MEQSYSGVRPIHVDHIIGTVGRGGDFDRCFNPLKPQLRERLRTVERAFKDGDFPPIDVYKMDSAFFVVDGHHRVAAARKMGMVTIDAVVTAIHTPYRVDATVDEERIELTEHERRFLIDSGLRKARPDARIAVSSANAYWELLEAVKAYGFDLMERRQEVLTRAEVASSWFDCVYLPTTRFSKEEGICDLLPSCTLGDLFLAVHRQHRAAFGSECETAERAMRGAIHQEHSLLQKTNQRWIRRGSSKATTRRPLDPA